MRHRLGWRRACRRRICAYDRGGFTGQQRADAELSAPTSRDSWSILPNLTLNAGVRWEQQTLYSAEDIQGEISPTTGEPIPDEAFKLNNMLAPRLGVVYDWTQEGRSKVYAPLRPLLRVDPDGHQLARLRRRGHQHQRARPGRAAMRATRSPPATSMRRRPRPRPDLSGGGDRAGRAGPRRRSTWTSSCSAASTRSCPTSRSARRTSAATSAA